MPSSPRSARVAGPDWQKLACAMAARSAFAIVTGGPGTGKTTTVVRLLAVLQALALADSPARPLRIRLAAPTGKAAARLNESIAGAVARLDLAALPDGERVRAAIPVEVTTLHRLLGSRPDTRHFRHHAGNPLGVDVLVVDEALDGGSGDDGRRARRPAARGPPGAPRRQGTSSPRWKPARCWGSCAAALPKGTTPPIRWPGWPG
jgi:ATP-dependent exoDNAse (exonuclease V) alpha subunit